ncbi:hypothetical protein AVEN_81276-1 [Araneus ventricosus]|uniref:Mutator-like transposase domain-containing protein n=1 Tax=Araneus ventricosus TaxID=182803 RepID=A0A4Y2LXV4_ARAVE|nr:hypothetical protein AVEN_81276-1 [Araneus ventricosus]
MSREVSQHKVLNAPFDVNMRLVQGMLSLGLGYSALEKFCMNMNLNIMSSRTFNFYKKKILDGHLFAANQMLCNIREDVKKAYGSRNDNDIIDIGVSYDGSWLTRGHTSNIGIGCVIDLMTGFVIDFEVMSKRCEECQQTELALDEDTAEFHFWYECHRDFCSITHVGSSGSMEAKAAIKLWGRSESIDFRYSLTVTQKHS